VSCLYGSIHCFHDLHRIGTALYVDLPKENVLKCGLSARWEVNNNNKKKQHRSTQPDRFPRQDIIKS